LALAAVVFVSIAGCGRQSRVAEQGPPPDPAEKLYGKWEGKPRTTNKADSNDAAAKMAEGMLQAFGGIKLELVKDRTFEMNFAFIPLEGNWRLDGDKVRLVPTKVMGMDRESLQKMAPSQSVKPISNPASPPDDKPARDLGEPIELRIKGETLVMPGDKDDEIVFTRSKA
jgi:hypothetical protein